MSLKNGTKIGCLGLGNMGTAIIHGLSSQFSREHIFGFDSDSGKATSLSTHLTIVDSPDSLFENCDIIIIALKPDVILPILKKNREKIKSNIIVSIAAGITINSMEDSIGSDKKIFRVMPNTPALVSEAMTVLSPNNNCDEQDINLVDDIFSLLGKSLILDEKYLDAVTGVSGCGPAYGFTMIQAMADGGVKMGLPRNKALILAAQTLKGAAEMVLKSNDNPISLRDKVCSPGGSTIAGVHKLQKSGFAGIVMDTVEEATIVSEKLGKKDE